MAQPHRQLPLPFKPADLPARAAADELSRDALAYVREANPVRREAIFARLWPALDGIAGVLLKKFNAIPHFDEADLRQEMHAAMIKALPNYVAEAGTLRVFMFICGERRMKSLLRYSGRAMRREERDDWRVESVERQDRDLQPSEHAECAEQLWLIESIATPAERRIIKARLAGQSDRQIAKQRNSKASRVALLRQRLAQRLESYQAAQKPTA